MPYARAEWWDRDYTDRKFREQFEPFQNTMNRNVEIYNQRLRDIDDSIAKLETTVKELQAANKDLAKRVSDIDGKPLPDPGPLLPSWALYIIMTVCAIVIAFVILVFWPQRKSNSSTSVGPTSRPKCPYCGWEHDPGDTICKNPNCKTQF